MSRINKTTLVILAVISFIIGMTLSTTRAEAHEITPVQCRSYAQMHTFVTSDPQQGRRAFRACIAAAEQHKVRHCLQLDGYGRRNACVIRVVFGGWGDQAVSVATCESGLRTRATNGQYLGLFQMGTDERATYGHGDTAEEQSRAAWRYFDASGRDWSPWECKP